VSDWWAVAMAAAGFAGALGAIRGVVGPVPLLLGIGVAVVPLAARRPAVLCLGVALLTAGLAQRSLAGLGPPATGRVRAEVTLVADPVPDGRGGVQVDVRLHGHRLAARAHAAAAAALDDRLAGERVTALGTVMPPGTTERRALYRHLAGRLEIEAVAGWRPGHAVTRAANGLRRTLARGAQVLPERQRSLLAGLTLGDDRDQPADMTDAFEGAGLTHLLAVSGENLAFVLVVFGPLLVRLRFAPRLAATLGVLGGFALLTRFEPSVLRATAMAAVAATGTVLGRPASSLRTLGLGVTAILLIDPLLASSLGFQLSAAGTAGIVVGAARLQRFLPGPRWCTAPLSVTLAAQAAVAPLLVGPFGPVPLASVPANLLAVPAAGPVMVWGLTAGLVAGLAGGVVARVIHLPTRLLLTWIEAVALTTSRWPLGAVDAVGLIALAAGALALAASRTLRAHTTGPDTAGRGRGGVVGRVLQGVGAVVMVGALVRALAPVGVPPGFGSDDIAIGATAWRGGGAVILVVDGRALDRYVLSGLREAGIPRVDVVVLRSVARTALDTVGTMRRRWPGVAVVAPSLDGRPALDGAIDPPTGATIAVGGLHLAVVGDSGGHLDVRIWPRAEPSPSPTGSPGARSPRT
jgi:competence protein ComEC